MKVLISLSVVFLCLVVFLMIQKKYRLTKTQLAIFTLLTLFWLSVGMIRDYRKRYALMSVVEGGLGLTPIIASNIAAGYGLISMIVRFPIFVLSDFFQQKKIFIQCALWLLLISSGLVVFFPHENTLFFSSLALGFAASLLALFNVAFASTFTKENALISVSILSIAPLLAEFLSSALQYFILKDNQNYSLLWLFSCVFAIGALLLTFKLKDFNSDGKQFNMVVLKKVFKNKTFLLLCITAVFISFIRFSTSGTNLNTYVKQLGMDEFYIAYIDVVFSIAQLLAGVLMGLYFQKRFGIKKTLCLGLLSSLSYIILLMITQNTQLLFYTYLLHGFGYGICYNSLIGLALQLFDKQERNVSMGIFQAFFAIGIYYGDKVYTFVLSLVPNGFLGFSAQNSIFFIVMMLVVCTIIMVIISDYKHEVAL